MTHARFPDFSQPLPAATQTIEHAPSFSDPILAAIDRHNEAWSVYQVAPEGAASDAANLETYDALAALLSTPCASRFGSLALLSHLRWWLAEEAPNGSSYAEHWAIAEARAADLTLFLGTPALLSVYPEQERVGHAAARVARRITGSRRARDVRFIRSIPDETPGGIEPWQAVTPIRPDTAHVRSPRLLDGMGEAFAALGLICGGALLVGLATLA